MVVFFSAMAVYHSFKSRRASSLELRFTHAAKMNISMGVMLLAIAIIQIFLFPYSTVRLVFGTVCLLLGTFNLYSGIRNLLYFRTRTFRDNNGRN